MYINKPHLSISRRCPPQLTAVKPADTRVSVVKSAPTRKFYCTHYTDIYGKHIQTAQNGKRATESSKLEEQHPFFILRCTQSLFRLRSQCHFPPEANPPLSLHCPPHHAGFTPDAEAPWSAALRHAKAAPRQGCLAPWSAAPRCAVKRSFRRRVYFLRSPRAYRARKHTEKWAVCVITERNRRMTGVGKCASGVYSQAPAL